MKLPVTGISLTLCLLTLAGCASERGSPLIGDQGATFGQVDLDGNGLVSQREFEASGLMQSWQQVDLDHNGFLDQQEFRKVYGPSALDLHQND